MDEQPLGLMEPGSYWRERVKLPSGEIVTVIRFRDGSGMKEPAPSKPDAGATGFLTGESSGGPREVSLSVRSTSQAK
jgi:hypothetical protein